MATLKNLKADDGLVVHKFEASILKASTYEGLPVASNKVLGITKIDDITIKLNQNNELYAISSNTEYDDTEIKNHISNATIHLTNFQIETLSNSFLHINNTEKHISASDRALLTSLSQLSTNLSTHTSNKDIHVTIQDKNNLILSTEHITDGTKHITSDERNKINTINTLFTNFDTHTQNTNIHFTDNEKTTYKNSLADNTRDILDLKKFKTTTESSIATISSSKLNKGSHTANKILYTDNDGNVGYHVISADKLASTDNIAAVQSTITNHISNSQFHTTATDKTNLATAYNHSQSSHLSLGTSSTTAYRGDYGNIAYNHSQSVHAPSNAQANVQADWNASSGDSYIKNKPSIPTIPSSLPANGGNADTVGGYKITVSQSQPGSAKAGDIWISW